MERYTLFKATTSKAMCILETDGNKIFLTIWPQSKSKKKKFDWDKRKIFTFEDSEICVMINFLKIYQKQNIEKAKEYCKKLTIGFDKDNKPISSPMFFHSYGNNHAQGGLSILSDKKAIDTAEKKGYAPIRLAISKDNEFLSVLLSKKQILELITKLSIYIDEKTRSLVNFALSKNVLKKENEEDLELDA